MSLRVKTVKRDRVALKYVVEKQERELSSLDKRWIEEEVIDYNNNNREQDEPEEKF